MCFFVLRQLIKKIYFFMFELSRYCIVLLIYFLSVISLVFDSIVPFLNFSLFRFFGSYISFALYFTFSFFGSYTV